MKFNNTLPSGDGVRESVDRSIVSVWEEETSSNASSSSSISFSDVALIDEPTDTRLLAGDAGHPLSSFHCLPVRSFCGNFGLNK